MRHKLCPNCTAMVVEGWRYCPACGQALTDKGVTGPDEAFTIDAAWVHKSRKPEQAGWYYTRSDEYHALSMRYFDDSDGAWYFYGDEEFSPNDCFTAWLSLSGIAQGWKPAAPLQTDEPEESRAEWFARQCEKFRHMENALNDFDSRLSAARHALYMWGVPEKELTTNRVMDIAERIHWLHDNLLNQAKGMAEQAGSWQARYELLAKRYQESEERHAEELVKARAER